MDSYIWFGSGLVTFIIMCIVQYKHNPTHKIVDKFFFQALLICLVLGPIVAAIIIGSLFKRNHNEKE